MREPTELELAYLAGVIDSDGSIYISKQPPIGTQTSPRYRLCLNISQNTQEVQNLAEEIWGGVRAEQKRNIRAGRHHTLFRWQVDDRKAIEIIAALRPYLRVKAHQAWLGLEFRANYTMHNPLRPEDNAIREGFYLAMKQAKVGAMEGGDPDSR